MDDLNNNGMANTQNPVTPLPDYNSMQPQSNPLGVLPVDDSTTNPSSTNVASDQSSSLVDSLAGIPQDLQSTDIPTPVVTQEEVSTSVVTDPVLDSAPENSGVVDLTPPQTDMPPMVDTMPTTPVMDAPVQPDVLPTMDSMMTAPVVDAPVVNSSMDAMSSTPVMDMPVQPDVMPTMDSMMTSPVVDAPVVNPSMDTMSSAPVMDMPVQPDVMPTMNTTPVMDTPVVQTGIDSFTTTLPQTPVPDSQPAFPSVDMSTNLSQPLESVAFASATQSVQPSVEEVVNTLEGAEKEEEGKDSNVVIIVLVVLIVLLLAGIGYFGYKIFLA